jgi:hypothetical protein
MCEEIKKTRDENYLIYLVTAMYKSREKESYSQSYLKLHHLDDNNNNINNNNNLW